MKNCENANKNPELKPDFDRQLKELRNGINKELLGNEPEATIYSIGHGRKTFEELLKELNSYRISYLIDVRTVPYSKWSPQFNQEIIKSELKSKTNIKYDWWADRESDTYIGGRPLDNSCFDDEGYFDYYKMAKYPSFQKGLERLVMAQENGFKVQRK